MWCLCMKNFPFFLQKIRRFKLCPPPKIIEHWERDCFSSKFKRLKIAKFKRLKIVLALSSRHSPSSINCLSCKYERFRPAPPPPSPTHTHRHNSSTDNFSYLAIFWETINSHDCDCGQSIPCSLRFQGHLTPIRMASDHLPIFTIFSPRLFSCLHVDLCKLDPWITVSLDPP